MSVEPDVLGGSRLAFGLLAATALCVGLFALFWPIHLDDWDQWGFQISCGTAIAVDHAQAALADQHSKDQAGQNDSKPSTDYVSACESATWWRRGWATVVATFGITGLLISVFDLLRGQHSAEETMPAGRHLGNDDDTVQT